MSLRFTEGVADLPREYSPQSGQSNYRNGVSAGTLAKGNVILRKIGRNIGMPRTLDRQ